MFDTVFTHNDPDHYHDEKLLLHDCTAEKILYKDGVLRLYFPEGFWVTPNHEESGLDKTVRTDAAQVDFCVKDINDISIHVYTRTAFKRTMVTYWNAGDLIDAVNSGKCTIEFIYQYRTYFEQMWRCDLCFQKRPYCGECQLHIPGAKATYRWNHLRPECEW